VSSAGCVRAIIIKNSKIVLVKRNKFGEEYYTLPGGHIEIDETEEQAVERELLEETSLHVTGMKKVFRQPAAGNFTDQHVYVCTVDGDEIQLSPESDEAALNKIGDNTYTPGWYSLDDLQVLTFRTAQLASAILRGSKEGWPADVVDLTPDE
jgi:8-oxo-dGTP diphosphatase